MMSWRILMAAAFLANIAVQAHRDESQASAVLAVDEADEKTSTLGQGVVVKCSDVKHLECDGGHDELQLFGDTIDAACQKDYKENNQIVGQLFNKIAQAAGSSCKGPSALSKGRWKVTFPNEPKVANRPKRRRCCLCPPGARWQKTGQQCVCETRNSTVLVAQGGKCLSSSDDFQREEARAALEAGKKATAMESGSDNFDPALLRVLKYQGQPAKQQIELATAYCKSHREIDELAPAVNGMWLAVPVRMGLGVPVAGLGFLNGLAIESLNILKFDARLTLTRSPGGLTLTIAPSEDGGETIRVALNDLTLWVDGVETRIIKKTNSSTFGAYLLELGGRLHGTDLMTDIVRYRSNLNIVFEQTFWKMGNLKSDSTLVGLLGTFGNTGFVEGQAKALVEWLVSDWVSKKLFGAIAANLAFLAEETRSFAGIDAFPMSILLKSTGTSGDLLNLELEVQQGAIAEGKTEFMKGFAIPTFTGTFTAESDTVSFDLTSRSQLDVARLLEEQADTWNVASVQEASHDTNPKYIEEQQAKNAKPSETSTPTVSTGGNCKKAEEYGEWLADESSPLTTGIGSAIWNWATAPTKINVNVETTIPVDPSPERAQLESYLLSLWEAQHPGKSGIMQRTPKTGNPDYTIYSMNDVSLVIGGQLKGTVSGGVARLAGELELTDLALEGVAIDGIVPLPCHTTEGCTLEQNTWKPSRLSYYVPSPLQVKTPLPVTVATSVRGEAVETCVTLNGEVTIEDTASWAAYLANKASGWFDVKTTAETFIQTALDGIVKAMVSQFHEKGLQSFTVNLNLDSRTEVSVQVFGTGSYHTLGDLQALSASQPPAKLLESQVGKGWNRLRTLLTTQSFTGASPTAQSHGAKVSAGMLSLHPSVWFRKGWALAVDELFRGFRVEMMVDPKQVPLMTVRGSLSLDLIGTIKAFTNDGGQWNMGEHGAAAGIVRLEKEGIMFTKSVWEDWEAIVSCGSLYFVPPGTRGTPYTIVNRADEARTVDLTQMADDGSMISQIVSKSPCEDGYVGYSVRGRTKYKAFPICVAQGSSLDAGIAYEMIRAAEIINLMRGPDFTSSAAWSVDGSYMKTEAFDWIRRGRLPDSCTKELERCAMHFPCQGVSLKDEKCDFIGFKEINLLSRDSAAILAHKQWQVGPPGAWGAPPSGR